MKNLTKTVRSGIWLLVLVATVAFVEQRRTQRTCQELVIQIEQTDEHRFIAPGDIRQLVTQQQTTPLEGVRLRDINLKMLERNVATNNYVQWVNAYYGLNGEVVIQTLQNRPIARISQTNAPDAYLGNDGRMLPLSERFTARVMVLGGDYMERLVKIDVPQDSAGARILSLVQHIDQDEFWRTQIAQVDINEKGSVVLYPQIGKQRINFGQADRLSEKFDKLSVFYDQILPRQGWNRYEEVSLEYQNQIVCQ